MSLLDIFKKRELEEIANLKREYKNIFDSYTDLTSQYEEQSALLAQLQKEQERSIQELSFFKEIKDINKEKEKLLNEIKIKKHSMQEEENKYEIKIKSQKDEIIELENEINNKKKEIVELDDTILLQEFGLYSPVYDFANSDTYKERLQEIRNEQKQMLRCGDAALCSKDWVIDGSISKGKTFINKNIKQIIRCFNNECDILIDKVKFNNAEAFIHKMVKTYDELNKLNEPNCISITQTYLSLKIKELRLAYEYSLKKQQEKDEQKAIRERMREEAKLMAEIEERRKEVIKELSHYNKQAIKIEELLVKAPEEEKDYLLEKKKYIDLRLSELDREIKDMDYREANKKAGYVYIISNIGAFGENVYKIGMTRRLEPMDRIEELSNASVPFKFDVHAMIFSDDAPQLEAALHRAFDNRKVNMINGRKEFFRVKIEEIEDVVRKNYDKAVEFTTTPIAEQYRETIKLLNLNHYGK